VKTFDWAVLGGCAGVEQTEKEHGEVITNQLTDEWPSGQQIPHPVRVIMLVTESVTSVSSLNGSKELTLSSNAMFSQSSTQRHLVSDTCTMHQ